MTTAPDQPNTLASQPFDVPGHLAEVRERIAAAARRNAREPGAVKLVAITKVHGPERIVPALEAGHSLFGENRVQEAQGKWPALRERFADLALHLVGPLQTNKARDAVALFDAIETVDRPKLAAALAKEMDRVGRRPDCFIQVNTGEEPQKAGVLPLEVDDFVTACRETYALPVVGLMCIPPIDEEPALHFALLRDMAERNGLTGLSMGMTADFETAIAFGATHVRVGTAIFGPRPVRTGAQ